MTNKLPLLDEQEHSGEFVRLPDSLFTNANYTQQELQHLCAKWGVYKREILHERQHPTGKRVFFLRSLIPVRVSVDEVANADLTELAIVRKVRLCRLKRMRRTVRDREHHRGACAHHSSQSRGGSVLGGDAMESDEQREGSRGEVSTPPYSPASSSFSCDFAAAAATAAAAPAHVLSCLSKVCHSESESVRLMPTLSLLVEVAEEKQAAAADTHQASDDSDGIDPVLTGRLGEYPLPVLREVSGALTDAKDTLERDFIACQEDAAAEAIASFLHGRNNLLLFNVCLWQRRHPLEIAAFVLELYRTGALAEHAMAARRYDDTTWEALRVPAGFPLPPSPIPVMDTLMEALTASLHPELQSVPWRIRCDVLMTYPLLPYAQQFAMMEALSAQAKREHQCLTASGEALAEDRSSAAPTTPQQLLHGYAPDAAIPDRFSGSLTSAQYLELRAALERHKKDGVRRLCNCDYR